MPRLGVLTDWCVLLAAIVVPINVAALTRGTPHVSRVTIVNPTPYMLEIHASTPTDATLSLVTIMDPGERDALDFADRGDTWVLHFRGEGYDAATVEVDRADFIEDGRYEIPTSVGEQITDLKQL